MLIISGTGGEYPASSVSASETANDLTLKQRGPAFIMVTNFPLSFGGPFAVLVFLIVFSACQQSHYSTVWRVCFGIGCIWPLSVFYFRWRMLNSALYRRGAIKKRVPYGLVIRYYWKSLIGTCGAWFLYGTYPSPSPDLSITSNLIQTSSPSPTASFPPASSPPWSATTQFSKPANGSSSSEPFPSPVSSSALSSATNSVAKT